ncbi:RraA family protein [Kibdelosporangium phytohabitans]|uniref:Putative 4-hydroxy-4-methyl-2-oxoglutarate aldolase n=1 Tax=Kibdelosporangium phytohabitans TaxID=860235 RepID=A0A0N9I124_9PSEU|nr:RraA family protein [Kibdelosporangium phytohabitans]ALG11267.1 dimethylmenaquinone methyltransferase [Kibdelosporangium phytohabitans]MBE1462556.1 regulator of RNase E activity RraA [Kibdelosporangium phytohabitans]
MELIDRFAEVDTTAICDADKTTRVMDSGIRPRSAQSRVFGPAFTVRCRDDFLGVLRAIEAARPGDVIVVDGGGRELALAGEMFARGALVRRLGGIIIDAGYRDIAYVSRCALPIYSRFVTPMAGTTVKLGELRVPVTCGGVAVNPGDMILADEEGVLVVDPARVEGLLDAAAAVKKAEAGLAANLAGGRTLSDGTNLAEHVAALERGEPSKLTFT